ncbi:ligase [Vibrio panuliri]|uniref:Ligase n=1 Tax=Vibrio panuliri TaxID=1381081 RepID=A0A1Q9HAI0_9VIBR|nr:O-antigen ligase family protein [Vibrio panuliri]OLQ86132.1 ligase [Vibrio panuliri]
MMFKDFYPKAICWCLALVPALLLTTNNFSVGVIILALIISLICLKKSNKEALQWTKFDSLVAICFSFYFLGAIPVAIADGSTARYFQGGARLLLCLPIYIALSRTLFKQTLPLRTFLENGLIIGSFGAFTIACYQYFYLGMLRVNGFLFSINFGYLACAMAFLAATMMLTSNKKLFLALSFILSVFSVTLTLTRGAIFAIPLVLIVYILLNIRHLNFTRIIIGIILFSCTSIFAYKNFDGFQNRIDHTVKEFNFIKQGNINNAVSTGDRLQFWYGAIVAFDKSPLIGLPYKQREALNHQLYLDGKIGERASKISRGHAHSQYFEMLASNGVLGIISLITIFVIPFFVFALHYFSTQSPWALTGAIFVSGFAIFGLTEVPLTANVIGSFYGFMLAVFFAIVAADKHNQKLTVE